MMLGRLIDRVSILEEMYEQLTLEQFHSLKLYLNYRKAHKSNRNISEFSNNELWKALQLYVGYPRFLKYKEEPNDFD